MQQGSGFLLVVFGLLALWVVISGKFDLLESFFYQLLDIPLPSGTKQTTTGPSALPGAGVSGEAITQKSIDDLVNEIGGSGVVKGATTPPFAEPTTRQ